ncbi:PAS domain S-box protein [Halorientalis pallida]|nr:PAS domain-containing protein [Halorientalis pallida]
MERNRQRSATRIGLDIERDRNRELLENLFSEYAAFELSGTVPARTDLCVIDAPALERSAERFDEWHARQSPVFAPVALLSETAASNPRGQVAALSSSAVDAILRIPMPKAELSARIDNLLQMREFSQELDEERQLTELVFESSPLAKLVLDPDGTVVRANRRAGELLDVDPAALVGRAYDDGDWTAVREDGTEIPTADRPFGRLLDTGHPVYGYEHVLERPGRDDMWVSVNMAPIRDESDRIDYVVAVIEDVTVRHSQARELERQLDLFQKAQDIAKVGAWEYDVRTESLYWTDQVYDLFGLSSDTTLTPESATELYHPDDQESIRDAFRRAIDDGEPYDLELRAIRADGERRWIRTRGEPQRADGDVIRLRGTIQDVTDRKERENSLQRMTNAVDRAPIGITLSDPDQEDNPLIYVNEGFVEQTGYTAREAIGRNCRFLQGPDTDETTVATLRRAIDAGEPVSVTIKNYRADGTPFWNHLEVAPVRDDDGTVVNFIGFQQNVTDTVDRQRQLAVLDRYLRHNVRNRTNVINGLAELIQNESEPPVTDYADSIERAGATLIDNIEKEREITKLLRDDPEPTTIELTSLLESIDTELTRRYPEADITVTGPESVTVEAVPELSSAFEELVRNAIEHNESPSPTVDITIERAADTVRVTVRDDGPGIPEMEVDVLVDADTETPLNHGQGLGLRLIYLLVSHSDGHIELAERGSAGSAVTVDIPRTDP